jgi:hypothetical protein
MRAEKCSKTEKQKDKPFGCYITLFGDIIYTKQYFNNS